MFIVYLNNLIDKIFRIDTLVVLVAVPIILLGLYFVEEEEKRELLKRSFKYISLGYTAVAGHADNGKGGRIGKRTSISPFFLSLCLAGKRPFLWLIGNGVLRNGCDQSFKEDAF